MADLSIRMFLDLAACEDCHIDAGPFHSQYLPKSCLEQHGNIARTRVSDCDTYLMILHDLRFDNDMQKILDFF